MSNSYSNVLVINNNDLSQGRRLLVGSSFHGTGSFFVKLMVDLLVKKFPSIMEPHGSLSCSQKPDIVSDSEPAHILSHCISSINLKKIIPFLSGPKCYFLFKIFD
jgi:hypothetical protein